MHINTHTIISLFTGAVVVNVPTPMDAIFSTDMIIGATIFISKGIIGALISVGINKYVDYKKNKNTSN
jgi:hypothetical protein